jgi:hypothetical protein
MQELAIQAVRGVNLLYTIIIGLLSMYWISVILGFLDIEIFDFDLDLDLDTEIEGVGAGGILGILNVGSIPFSIWMSIFALQMWVYSVVFNLALDAIPDFRLPNGLRFIIGAILFIPIAATVTKFATTPLKKAFEVKSITKHDFVGKVCIVTSSEVNEQFGTAEIRIGNSPQIIDIRAKPDEEIKRDEKALIYQYDDEQDVFYVTSDQ